MSCSIEGLPDLYGLGIRLGLYLCWFGVVFVSWLGPQHNVRLSHTLLLYILAVFVAVVLPLSSQTTTTSTASTASTLRPVEVYLAILLLYGSYYVYVPFFLWQVLTGFSPFWDPTRWSPSLAGQMWAALNVFCMLAATSFQLWFWSGGLTSLGSDSLGIDGDGETDTCPEYGFFFAQVDLQNPLFVGFHIVVMVFLLVFVVLHGCFDCEIFRKPRWLRKKIRRADRKGVSLQRRDGLVFLHAMLRCTVATLVVIAVEMTIQWNGIANVGDLSSASQLIAFLLPLAIFVHVGWDALASIGQPPSPPQTRLSFSTRRTSAQSEGPSPGPAPAAV